MLQGKLFLTLLFAALAFADLLQNPDFESPPSNLPQNSTNPVVLSSQNNTIPGWTFEGTVLYITASQKIIALPDNGHAIQLGEDGKINQTFIANTDYRHYLLTFTVAPGGQNCSSNADIVVAAPDSKGIFSLKQHYGKESWVIYGHFLGSWDEEEPINLVIQSQTAESNSSSICWPLIDNLLLKSIPNLVQGSDNLLLNEGFEIGPEFPNDSTVGILIDPASSPVQSPLQGWSVIGGPVKYIDSKHFFVPQGNAAIELLSGNSTGIQTATTLKEGSSYNLEFKLGDANNSCVKDFIVVAQAGSIVQNFTLQSNGSGSSKEFSMKFKADSSMTPISFLSYTTSQTEDGVFCGPVIDDVVLHASLGLKLEIPLQLLISLYLVAFLCYQ